MLSAGVFTNVNSGQNKLDWKKHRDHFRLKKFRSIVQDGERGKVYVTGTSEDWRQDLEDRVSEFCIDRPDLLVIDGGDGSISTVLTAVDAQWPEDQPLPPVVLIKGGTFNVLSKRLGIDGSYKQQHLVNAVNKRSIEDLMSENIQSINMMGCLDDSQNYHLCFSVGVGAIVNFLKEIDQKKHLKLLKVGWMMGKLFLSTLSKGKYYQKFNQKTRMTVDGVEDDWLLYVTQTVASLGMPKWMPKFKILEKTEKSHDRFLTVGTTMNLSRYFNYLPAILSDDPALQKTDFGNDRLIIKQMEETYLCSEEPMDYQFNGEYTYGKDPCRTRELYLTQGRKINFVVS